MATRTFTSAGVNNLWSNAANWDVAPGDGDAFTMSASQTCEFDADLSAWTGLAASTIPVGCTFRATETAGAYVLKMAGNLTVNGTLQAGTSVAVPYPSTCTFNINFSNTTFGIVRGATGSIKLYCTQPTYKYVTITEAGAVGEGTAADPLDVDTDVTADWTTGQEIAIIDSTPLDVEYFTLSAINAGSIEIGAVGLAAAKSANSIAVLVTRNVRITNVAASAYAITYNPTTGGTGDHIGAEINNCYRGINGGTGYTATGTCKLLTTSPMLAYIPTFCTYSGTFCGPASGTSYGLYYAGGCKVTTDGLMAGFTIGLFNGNGNHVSGTIWGCTSGADGEKSVIFDSLSTITRCTTAATRIATGFFYSDVVGNTNGISSSTDILLSSLILNNTNYELSLCGMGKANNCLFTGVAEFLFYANVNRLPNSYFESFNHDQVENAYKAWTLGGIVTSQTDSPPSGYSIWYNFACEPGSYAVFRQFQAVVLPGTAIEVEGLLRIPNAEDLSANPPSLQIVDFFADPLVDDTQSPLDVCYIPISNGTETGWQPVSCIHANKGESPITVLVRMIVYHDGGGDNVDVSGVWSIAGYKEEISMILSVIRPVKTSVSVSDSATSFTIGDGETAENAYKNMLIQVRDADTMYWQERSIKSWTSGRVVTVDTAFSFTPAVDDLVRIIGTGYGGPVDLQDDAITAAKFDETTAFPVTKADSGETEIARTGADGDTLETLSDQLDAIEANTGKVVYGSVISPTGVKKTIISGSATGFVPDEKDL